MMPFMLIVRGILNFYWDKHFNWTIFMQSFRSHEGEKSQLMKQARCGGALLLASNYDVY